MFAVNATDVRKDWSLIIDSVIREKPRFIKRTRDYMVLANVDFFIEMLSAYVFTALIYEEEDGTITIESKELDIVENASNKELAILKLAQEILNYAEQFYQDFNFWSSAPNRKSHIPYIFKALLINDPHKIGETIKCQSGEN